MWTAAVVEKNTTSDRRIFGFSRRMGKTKEVRLNIYGGVALDFPEMRGTKIKNMRLMGADSETQKTE